MSSATDYGLPEPCTGYMYSLKELEELPRLGIGQFDNRLLDDSDDEGSYRVWLSRMTVEDGMPYNNQVTIERYNRDSNRWYNARTYQARNAK